MNASLVAAIGQVHLHAKGNAQLERLGAHFLHEGAHETSFGAIPEPTIGWSETTRMPWVASCWPRFSASTRAASRATSYSVQILFLMISRSGVTPSAASQIVAAT